MFEILFLQCFASERNIGSFDNQSGCIYKIRYCNQNEELITLAIEPTIKTEIEFLHINGTQSMTIFNTKDCLKCQICFSQPFSEPIILKNEVEEILFPNKINSLEWHKYEPREVFPGNPKKKKKK